MVMSGQTPNATIYSNSRAKWTKSLKRKKPEVLKKGNLSKALSEGC